MEKIPYYVATSLWYRKEIKDPYKVIADAFEWDDIASYRTLIRNILTKVNSHKIYQKLRPVDVLFQLKMIESLINAAYLINMRKKSSSIKIRSRDMMDKRLYCPEHTKSSEWQYFPRILSEREYKNPHLVFKKFFKLYLLSFWKDHLKEIADHALSPNKTGFEKNVLSIFIYLGKLIEAAHLINVRRKLHTQDGQYKQIV